MTPQQARYKRCTYKVVYSPWSLSVVAECVTSAIECAKEITHLCLLIQIQLRKNISTRTPQRICAWPYRNSVADFSRWRLNEKNHGVCQLNKYVLQKRQVLTTPWHFSAKYHPFTQVFLTRNVIYPCLTGGSPC